MKKRLKIDWQKLVDGGYPASVRLQVFQWMLATGHRFETKPGRWGCTNGMDKLLYGYSACNYESLTPIGRNVEQTLSLAFLRAIVRTPDPWLAEWRKAEGVGLGKCRHLMFDLREPEVDFYKEGSWILFVEIARLYDLRHRRLRDDVGVFQSSMPYVKGVNLTANHEWFGVEVHYSIAEHPGGGWTVWIYQEEGESLDLFVRRASLQMKEWLLPEDGKCRNYYKVKVTTNEDKVAAIRHLYDCGYVMLPPSPATDYIIAYPLGHERTECRYVYAETYESLGFSFERTTVSVLEMEAARRRKK